MLTQKNSFREIFSINIKKFKLKKFFHEKIHGKKINTRIEYLLFMDQNQGKKQFDCKSKFNKFYNLR